MSQEALEGSMKKWKRIVRSTNGRDDGAENCSLCQTYYYSDRGCSRCPVSIKTGKSSCDGSPWQDWYDHMTEDHDYEDYPFQRQKGCKECLRLAKEELAFLESLRDTKVA